MSLNTELLLAHEQLGNIQLERAKFKSLGFHVLQKLNQSFACGDENKTLSFLREMKEITVTLSNNKKEYILAKNALRNGKRTSKA